jgi:hypothetical protein
MRPTLKTPFVRGSRLVASAAILACAALAAPPSALAGDGGLLRHFHRADAAPSAKPVPAPAVAPAPAPAPVAVAPVAVAPRHHALLGKHRRATPAALPIAVAAPAVSYVVLSYDPARHGVNRYATPAYLGTGRVAMATAVAIWEPYVDGGSVVGPRPPVALPVAAVQLAPVYRPVYRHHFLR